MSVVITKTYPAPSFDEREIWRYAGCKEVNEDLRRLLLECIAEIKEKLTYRLCYCELSFQEKNGLCDFGNFSLQSHSLAKTLQGSQRVLLFSATVGIDVDRLITKYGKVSPTKALLFQAIGTERIEALCDEFCNEWKVRGYVTTPRFSAGYGDLPLQSQKIILSVLESYKKIGVGLNESFLMSPSKSVTAFFGIR